jgi:hypothetical protein
MTYSGYEIWTKLRENSWATQPLADSTADSMRLRDGHAELSTSLARAQGGMANFWQGGAADAAASGLTPMIKAAQDNSTHLSNAVQAMNAQSEHFLRVRDTVVEVSNNRPNDWDLASFNPFGASDSEKAAAKWDADTRHNVDTYEPYYQATQTNNARMPVAYPDAHDPTVSVTPPEPIKPETRVELPGGPTSGVGGRHRADSGVPKQSGIGGPYQGSQRQQPPAAAWQPPPQTNQPSPSQPNPFPSEGTTPGGFSPPPPGSGSGFGPGAGGFGPGSGGFGPTGGTEFSTGGFGPLGGGGHSGGGSGGGAGGGLSGRGAGAAGGGGAAGELGQGKSTGTGMPGKPGPGGYGGAAANSAAGAKGAAGMSGMGAGGAGKGQGSDDAEHDRKIMLSGGDPDSVFGDNLPKTTSPVIGA